MIVYDLSCDNGHRFEGWFGSSSDFADQKASGLLSCPECGTPEVAKAPMAPSVPVKGNARSLVAIKDSDDSNDSAVGTPMAPASAAEAPAVAEESHPVSNTPMPAEVQKALTALAKAQHDALKKSTWVGDSFAEKSREMHYGEADEAPIHGKASAEEAQDLIDEGIAVAPLPFPIAEPDKLN